MTGELTAATACREQLAQLSVHADIASRLNRLIDEKFLVEMGKLEQDLVYGNATSKEVVTFLGYHQQLPTEDKVQSFCLMLESQVVDMGVRASA